MNPRMRELDYFRLTRHDILNAAGDPYMERWIARFANGGGIRLHHILRSDDDRALHDHPFDFTSLILSGSYVEHVPADPADPAGPTIEKVYRPGMLNRCRAEQLHRLELRDGPVWTLVRSAPKRREWGFYTPEGWVRWDDYEERAGVANHTRTA